jgi:hypothetical protein
MKIIKQIRFLMPEQRIFSPYIKIYLFILLFISIEGCKIKKNFTATQNFQTNETAYISDSTHLTTDIKNQITEENISEKNINIHEQITEIQYSKPDSSGQQYITSIKTTDKDFEKSIKDRLNRIFSTDKHTDSVNIYYGERTAFNSSITSTSQKIESKTSTPLWVWLISGVVGALLLVIIAWKTGVFKYIKSKLVKI